jgi:hypothetical protein
LKRQLEVDKTSDREGGWHSLVDSLEERYSSGTEFQTTPHIVDMNERALDSAFVSLIEKIAGHDYPFWRVRCKVTDG